MASTGFTLVGTGANVDDGSETAWPNPSNITDGSDATTSDNWLFGSGGTATANPTEQLRGTNLGFAIPGTATIDGIEVRIRRRRNSSASSQDHTVQLVSGGSLVGNNKATTTNWPASLASVDYGGATDLWGLTPSVSDVNASGFGVALKTWFGGASTTDTFYVADIWINVHYTDNPGDLFLRPTATSSAGSWLTNASGSDLHTAIDEVTADDADFIRSATDPSTDVCKIQLGTGSVDTAQPVRVKYRYQCSSTVNITLVVRLVEGSTTRATWTHTNIPTTIVAASQTLTSGEVASITSWSNLFLEFQATKV